MTDKLSKDLIKKIQSYPADKLSGEIANELGIHRKTVRKYRKDVEQKISNTIDIPKADIEKLELMKHLSPKQIKDILYHNEVLKTNDKLDIQTEETGRALFGAIGDTHFGSKKCNYEGLYKYYNACADRGVKTVLHAGDLVDGFDTYKGQTFELSKHSMDEQIQDVIDNYPKRDGIDTYYVLGNHDEQRLKIAGYDISKSIDNMRDDMHGLGFYNARIMLNGVDIELHHGGGSQSYAQSYKIQKFLENADPKNQPHVFLLGHYHTALYTFYRKIHALMVGAFQGETLLAKRFKLGNVNGGWIVDVSLDNKGGTTINLEFIKV